MASKKARKKRKSATTRKVRKSFTPEQRSAILAEAKEQKLTGKQVAEKHDISMVTYYLWKKKAGGTRKAGKKKTAATRASRDGVSGDIHAVVQAKVREVLPGIIEAEVSRALDSLLAGSSRRR